MLWLGPTAPPGIQNATGLAPASLARTSRDSPKLSYASRGSDGTRTRSLRITSPLRCPVAPLSRTLGKLGFFAGATRCGHPRLGQLAARSALVRDRGIEPRCRSGRFTAAWTSIVHITSRHGESRTPNLLILSQTPLPVGLRVLTAVLPCDRGARTHLPRMPPWSRFRGWRTSTGGATLPPCGPHMRIRRRVSGTRTRGCLVPNQVA